MSSKGENWIRCTKRNPCPLCGRDHYCEVSSDGNTVLCTKIESSKPAGNSGGWIHRLTEPIKPPPTPKKKQAPIPQPQMAKLAVEYFNRCQHPELLAMSLGLSVGSLRRVGMGYDGKNWSFPMFDADRHVIGIKLRPPAGKKFCVAGSHLGINWPKDLAGKPPLIVCEGETDTTAVLDLGFDAIGRPSCSGGTEIITAFLKAHRYQYVWIFADRDKPGLEGAGKLAQAIKPLVTGLKILHCPQHKDIRSLYNAGATRAVVEALAKNTTFWAMERAPEPCVAVQQRTAAS